MQSCVASNKILGAGIESRQESSVRVILRIKPDSCENPLLVKRDEGKTVMVKSHLKKCSSGVMEQGEKLYCVDDICDQDCSQADVFAKVGLDYADHVLSGCNATILAYGQTGSGKTYTMQGCGEVPGLCLWMFCHIVEQANIFNATHTDECWTCSCSCVELYNEATVDLSSDIVVDSAEAVFAVLSSANARLHFSSTAMNPRSSRSHLITSLTVTRRRAGGAGGGALPPLPPARLTMVDLAGSERVRTTRAAGVRLREAAHVNRSLLALGAVVAALAGRAAHVPYRASQLTRLLRDAVGGAGARLCLLAHASPLPACRPESLSTLRFAALAGAVRPRTPPPPPRRTGRRRPHAAASAAAAEPEYLLDAATAADHDDEDSDVAEHAPWAGGGAGRDAGLGRPGSGRGYGWAEGR
jgi:hypothetical protein